MTYIPQEVLAAVDAALDDLPQPDSRFERDRWRTVSRVTLNTAAPILTRETVGLLEEALFLRMNGERPPGHTENWRDWDDKAERFLRSLQPEVRED